MIIFEQNKCREKLGKRAGFLFGYLIFTAFLFFVFIFFKKIPPSESYPYILGATLFITALGMMVNWLLR